MGLPEPILLRIFSFLPQQETINFALTNYNLYILCLRKLYRRISVQLSPPLRAALEGCKKRDFVDSNYTSVYGFLERTSEENHLRLLDARIQALTESLSVNTQLIELVEEVAVDDALEGPVVESLRRLFAVLADHTGPTNVKKIHISDRGLRNTLNYAELKLRFASLESVTIDDYDELGDLPRFKNARELIVDVPETAPKAYYTPYLSDSPFNKTIDSLTGIKHLYVSPRGYRGFMLRLRQFQKLRRFKLDLKTFTMVHRHCENEPIPELAYDFLNFGTVQELQLTVGCDYGASCESHCMDLLCHELSYILTKSLRKLALVQLLERKNHAGNEHWDMAMLNFIKRLTAAHNNLVYVSIRHDTEASTGIINDGFEGNYLRRMKIYTELLPQVLKRNQSRKVSVVLPNFLSSLAFYEPAMNTMIWNGCKCGHCDTYLKLVDDFLFHHQYRKPGTDLYKDLVSSNVVYALGEALQRRFFRDPALGDLGLLRRPLKSVQWDFHSVDFSEEPLRCLAHKNFEEGEFEDDRETKKRAVSGQDVRCRFLQNEDLANYAVCMGHYLDDMMLKMVSLNRGNAEDVHIGGIEDENDGAVGLDLNKVVMSGIAYNLDRESNGTAFFENAYDGIIRR